MNLNKPVKSHYSEQEAATSLGLTVEDFRTLIKSHIVEREDDMAHVATAMFHPSDLLILRMILSGMKPALRSESQSVPTNP